MRQVVTTRNGGVEVLEVQTAPDPEPGPGEVIIDVRAAGLNFADILARQGLYPDGPKKPCVMGYEVSGTVEAAGEGLWRVGRVGILVGERQLGVAERGGARGAMRPAAAPSTRSSSA